MEQGKNNKGVVVFLVVLVIALAALCALFATGTISLKSNYTNIDNSNQQLTSEKNIDNDTLLKLLPIIGLDNDYKLKENCDYLSLLFINTNSSRIDNYTKDQAYALLIRNYQNKHSFDNSVDFNTCLKPGEVAPGANCYAYSKNEIKEIIKNYDLNYTADEIFADRIQKEDDDNYYVWNAWSGICSEYKYYKHNISSWNGYATGIDTSDDGTITIKDNITLKYENDDMTSRVIYYTFKKTDDGNNYKLWLYEIK